MAIKRSFDNRSAGNPANICTCTNNVSVLASFQLACNSHIYTSLPKSVAEEGDKNTYKCLIQQFYIHSVNMTRILIEVQICCLCKQRFVTFYTILFESIFLDEIVANLTWGFLFLHVVKFWNPVRHEHKFVRSLNMFSMNKLHLETKALVDSCQKSQISVE